MLRRLSFTTTGALIELLAAGRARVGEVLDRTDLQRRHIGRRAARRCAGCRRCRTVDRPLDFDLLVQVLLEVFATRAEVQTILPAGVQGGSARAGGAAGRAAARGYVLENELRCARSSCSGGAGGR